MGGEQQQPSIWSPFTISQKWKECLSTATKGQHLYSRAADTRQGEGENICEGDDAFEEPQLDDAKGEGENICEGDDAFEELLEFDTSEDEDVSEEDVVKTTELKPELKWMLVSHKQSRMYLANYIAEKTSMNATGEQICDGIKNFVTPIIQFRVDDVSKKDAKRIEKTLNRISECFSDEEPEAIFQKYLDANNIALKLPNQCKIRCPKNDVQSKSQKSFDDEEDEDEYEDEFMDEEREAQYIDHFVDDEYDAHQDAVQLQIPSQLDLSGV